MGNMHEAQFEIGHELHELELEGELGGLAGESGEGENEFESLLHEQEGGLGELHEFESEGEAWGEGESLHESGLHELTQHETGEQFFGGFKKFARGIGRFVKRAAPILSKVAKIAMPLVGTAIGGPVGATLGKVLGSALGEQEGELHELGAHETGLHELEGEFGAHEFSHELSHESSHELAHEIASHESTLHEAHAEMLAEAAAMETNEAHAEALMGAAVVSVLSAADRKALRELLPHLLRGVSVLTSLLRRSRLTRPAIRTVPTIMRLTVRSLKQQAAMGRPLNRTIAARTAATQIRRVLSSPSVCAATINRNVVINRRMGASSRLRMR